MDRSEFEKLIEYLKDKRVFIQTHNFPDPDAIGAGFGLQGILKHFGIDSILCYVGQIDRINTKKMTELCGIKIYPEDGTPLEMRSFDPVICVDSQKGGGNIKDLPGSSSADRKRELYLSRCEKGRKLRYIDHTVLRGAFHRAG